LVLKQANPDQLVRFSGSGMLVPQKQIWRVEPKDAFEMLQSMQIKALVNLYGRENCSQLFKIIKEKIAQASDTFTKDQKPHVENIQSKFTEQKNSLESLDTSDSDLSDNDNEEKTKGPNYIYEFLEYNPLSPDFIMGNCIDYDSS
jgi:hypothetical protein